MKDKTLCELFDEQKEEVYQDKDGGTWNVGSGWANYLGPPMLIKGCPECKKTVEYPHTHWYFVKATEKNCPNCGVAFPS